MLHIDLVAQDIEQEQFWVTGELRYGHGNNFSGKTKIEFRSIVEASERWRGGALSQEITYTTIPSVELTGGLRLFLTEQNDSLNRTELRPTFGVKIDFINKGRLQFNNYLRYEWRQFYYNNPGLNKSGGRLRNKLMGTYALNKEKAFLDKTFYMFFSFEFFLIKDLEVKDRFANRHSFEAGLGYKLDDHWKFTMSYFRQYSRDQIEEVFDTRVNILQLKCIYTVLK